jgi:GT2 family glycosyltransferase
MRSSIIVITRNRADSIGETLAALARQDHPDFEVLVVDSSEGPDREKTAACVAACGARFRYVYEPRRGQARARNTGIPLATGDLLAFTDDDCIPAPDWLAKKNAALADPAVWACTGRVVQHSREGDADLFEEVAGQDLGGERRQFSPADIRFNLAFLFGNLGKIFAKHMKARAPVPFGIGHGSSMAFKKETLAKIGNFDERFGSSSPFKGCEDIEMLYRVLKAGGAIVYEPAASLRHKHRFAPEEIYKTRYIYSFSGAAFLREHWDNPLMFIMFWGRLVQLLIKTAQYKLLRKKDLAQSFGSDLRGFREGWAAHRQYAREPRR